MTLEEFTTAWIAGHSEGFETGYSVAAGCKRSYDASTPEEDYLEWKEDQLIDKEDFLKLPKDIRNIILENQSRVLESYYNK